MNPISLNGDKPHLLGVHESRSDDDCEYFNRHYKELDECFGDGHYECKECKSFVPPQVFYTGPFGVTVAMLPDAVHS